MTVKLVHMPYAYERTLYAPRSLLQIENFMPSQTLFCVALCIAEYTLFA